jgi:hypothetical protein
MGTGNPELDIQSRTLGDGRVNETDRQRNQKYLKLLKALEDERLAILPTWRDISTYILPSRGLYVSDGDRPHDKSNVYNKILNATGTHSLNLLGAGMQGGLTSPSRPWKKLTTEDEGLMKFEPVAQWLDYVDALMDGVFKRSNFYEIIHQSYIDQAAFGSAVPFVEKDPESLVRFYLPPVGTYCVASDDTGRVNTFARRTWFTAVNLEKKFGGRISDQVGNAIKENPFKWFEVVHFVQPREERNIIFKDRFNMPYESVWFEYAKPDTTLFEGGFEEKPFAAGRWWINEPEVYGRSPGQMALGQVKLLQSNERGSTKAMHKEVDPPLQVPFGYKDVLDQMPGGINYNASTDGKTGGIQKLFEMRFDYVGIEAKIQRLEEHIQRLFFNDLFFTIVTGKEMTATEVLQRHEEQLIMLGPTIERQTSEVLDPIIERVFMCMLREGMIPPPPREMIGQTLKIDYVSTLAQAQKEIGIANMRAFKQDAMEIAQVSEDGLIVVNWAEYLQQEAFKLGVPAAITRSEDEIAAIKQANAEAAEQERRDLLMQNAADDVKKLSQADTSGKNALTDVVEAATE